MVFYSNQKLYDHLKELSIIPEGKLDSALAESASRGVGLHEILTSQDLITEENAGKAVATVIGLPFVDLSSVIFPDDAPLLIPEWYARRHKVVVIKDEPKSITVATAQPQDEIVKRLEKKAGKKIGLTFTTARSIEKALHIYKTNLQKDVDDIMTLEKRVEAEEKPIDQIVDMCISYGYSNGASDIHFEPERKDGLVRFRIDGIMRDVLKVSSAIHELMLSRIKVLSQLRTDEHLAPQDGKFQLQLEEENLDVRVSIVPLAHGEKCVMRLLASKFRQFGLKDLGMNSSDLDQVHDAFAKPHGMILATGPTGSGKTTTLYSVVKLLNTRDKNIATIEDPIEYDIEGINQIQVNAATNLTFANGLRSILRQDPDIMYVGEIRDNETADIAINSALTGHLVLSTLHTNDASTTLPRLIDMGIEPFLIASSINIIIAQRLVRKICINCKVSYEEQASELLRVIPALKSNPRFKKAKTFTFFKGKGCLVCHHTGYSGRIGIYEVLTISEEIRKLIIEKTSSDKIQEQAVKEGMSTMLDDGLEKVFEGVTTLEEIIRTTMT